MLLQNTVDPWSRLHCDKHRVAELMGNRGVLHDHTRAVRKSWDGKRWICCLTEFKGIDRRPLFKTSPFSYTELFFLDEATAYAAGHRPCNDCRKEGLKVFKRLWADLPERSAASKFVGVQEIDSQLQRERVDENGNKATFRQSLSVLPTGTMISHEDHAYLVRDRRVVRWTSAGYLPASLSAQMETQVLTPKSIVQLIRLGLPVQVHKSADA